MPLSFMQLPPPQYLSLSTPLPLAARLQSISAAGFKLRHVSLPVCFKITRQLLIFLGGGVLLSLWNVKEVTGWELLFSVRRVEDEEWKNKTGCW